MKTPLVKIIIMVMIMGNEQGNCINNGEANRGNVPTLDALLYRVYHTVLTLSIADYLIKYTL